MRRTEFWPAAPKPPGRQKSPLRGPSDCRGGPRGLGPNAPRASADPGLLVWFIGFVLVACGCRPATEESSRRAEPPLPVAGKVEVDEESAGNIADTPFTLTDQTGAEFSSTSLAGKVWMGAIFFSNCPGPCFRENQAIADILAEIQDPDFVVVSLTCDPVNDTPDVLRRYADRFSADPARWKFLTGEMKVISDVGLKTFKLPVEVGVHSERGVVFDRQGRLRGGYHLLQQDRVDELKKLIREVLAEKGPPSDEAAPPAAAEAAK